MKLFRYENYNVVISEEALLLKPFKTIWKRDRTKDKHIALLLLGFIYFYCDPRSEFMYLLDDDERAAAIKDASGMSKKWLPDLVVIDGINLYNLLIKTTSSLLLEDTKTLIEKIRLYLKDINLTDTDDKGRPIYPLNMITDTIKKIPLLILEVSKVEKAIQKELEENTRMRGLGVTTVFDEGINL